jgi:hypothetical protein
VTSAIPPHSLAPSVIAPQASSLLGALFLFSILVAALVTWRRLWYRKVYLRRSHWQEFRQAWWRAHPTAVCYECGGSGPMDLHHLTYERLGRERFEDVVPLHRRCHRIWHARRSVGIV